MRVKDHKKFACFEYTSQKSSLIKLGDVVKKTYNDEIYKDTEEYGKVEIGVIIQIHEEREFRTDMFGNCSFSEIEKVDSIEEIKKYRPDILEHLEGMPIKVKKKRKKKVAKLVTVNFMTRVIVDSDATEDEIIAASYKGFQDKLDNREVGDNLESIEDDTEVPYNPAIDGE